MRLSNEELLREILSELEARGCAPVWKEDKGEYQAHCPFHDDEHKSMWINPRGYWNCFACSPHGREATHVGLAEKLGILDTENVGGIPAFRTFEELVNYMHRELIRTPSLVEYLKNNRCLSEDVIKRAKLGLFKHNDTYYLVIPIYNSEGVLVNAKLRLLSHNDGSFIFASDFSQNPKYRWMTNMHPLVKEGAETPSLYPLQFDWKDEYVWIAGGELDALALWSVGIAAIAPTKGETSIRHEDLDMLPDWVVIALDAEEEVQSKARGYINRLLQTGKTVTHLIWKEKDVTEVLFNNGSLWKSIIHARTLRGQKQVNTGIIPAGETTYYALKLKENDETYTVYAMTQNLWLPEVALPVSEDETSFVVVGKIKLPWQTKTIVSTGGEFSVSALHRNVGVLSPALLGKNRLTQVIGNFSSDIRSLFAPTNFTFPRPGLYLSPDYNLASRQGLADWQAPRTVFVFYDGTIPEVNGKFYDIYLQNIFSSISAFAEGNDEELKAFVEDLLHIYPDESLYAVLAWFHASMLSTFVRLVNENRFPVLFVAGIAGTGKTSIVVDLLQKIFAPTPHIPSRQTTSTMRKYTNMSSFPLVLDEFTPERWGDDIKEAKLFVHSCYEMLMQQVSRSARQLEIPYFSYTPLCCIGESATFIIKDPAISDRVFLVTFRRKTEKLDKEYQDLFKKVVGQTHIHPYYRYRLLNFLIEHENEWMDWWKNAEQIVREQVGAEYSARQVNNFTVVVFGWIIFQEFAKSLGVVVPKAGDIAHYFFGKTETAPLHDIAARILSYWWSEKDDLLVKEEDWGIVKRGENAGKLWINLKPFLDKLHKRYRDERLFQMSSYEVYLQLKSAYERHHPVIVGLDKVVRNSENKNIRVIVFDLEVAKRDFMPDIVAEDQLELETTEEGEESVQLPF
jgi:hypothetical protein